MDLDDLFVNNDVPAGPRRLRADELGRELGPSYAHAAYRLLGSKAIELLEGPMVFHYIKSRAWAVDVKPGVDLQAAGKTFFRQLVGKRSLTAADPFLHDMRLYLVGPTEIVVIDPPAKKGRSGGETYEPIVRKWQAGVPLNAFERKLLERAFARLFDAGAQAPRKTARAYADELVAVFVAHGVHFTRAWDAPGVGARVYFPGEAGFLSISGGGDAGTVLRGRRTFDPQGLPPSWRTKVREALALYNAQRVTL